MVGSQGEDWGWLRDHSLEGASAPRLAGRESVKRSGTVEEARDFFLVLNQLVETLVKVLQMGLIQYSLKEYSS